DINLRFHIGQLRLQVLQFLIQVCADLRWGEAFLKFSRVLGLRQGERESSLFLFANHPYIDRSALAVADRLTEIPGIADRLAVHPDNHVAGVETGFLCTTALLHRAHQYSLAIFRPEEVAQLRAHVLHHQTAVGRGMNHHNRSWNIQLRKSSEVWHHKLEFRGQYRKIFAAGGVRLQGQWVAVAAGGLPDAAPRRDFVNHAPQLLYALHWFAIDTQDHVMLSNSSLPGRSVLIHHGDFHSALFLQLQWANALCRDVTGVHAQIRASACGFVAPVASGLAWVNGSAVRVTRAYRDKRQNQHHLENGMIHVRPSRWLLANQFAVLMPIRCGPATECPRCRLSGLTGSGPFGRWYRRAPVALNAKPPCEYRDRCH